MSQSYTPLPCGRNYCALDDCDYFWYEGAHAGCGMDTSPLHPVPEPSPQANPCKGCYAYGVIDCSHGCALDEDTFADEPVGETIGDAVAIHKCPECGMFYGGDDLTCPYVHE